MRQGSLRQIAAAHHRSFDRSDRSRMRTLAALYGPAIATSSALLIAAVAADDLVELKGSISDGLVAALTLRAGLLFSLGVTVLDKAIDLDLATPAPSSATTQAALRLQALSANALFTAILAGSATGLLLVGALVPGLGTWTTVAAAGLVVAVGTSGVAVSARLFAETMHRTDRTRTGESRRASDVRED